MKLRHEICTLHRWHDIMNLKYEVRNADTTWNTNMTSEVGIWIMNWKYEIRACCVVLVAGGRLERRSWVTNSKSKDRNNKSSAW
jgi:hypothetical protein